MHQPQVQKNSIKLFNDDDQNSLTCGINTFDNNSDLRCPPKSFDVETKTTKRPLPAPRFSKRTAKKTPLPSKRAEQKVQKHLDFSCKEQPKGLSNEKHAQVIIFPIYDEFELNLMEEIEREFGIRNF